MTRKDKDKLTVKNKKYARRLAETGEIGQSALDVGYKQAQYGSQLMRQPKILTALQTEMEKLKVNDAVIVRKLKEGLQATRVIRDGGDEYPDYHAQHKFLDMILKIRGDYAPEKHQISTKEITIVITPEVLKGLKDSRAVTEAEIEELSREPLDDD